MRHLRLFLLLLLVAGFLPASAPLPPLSNGRPRTATEEHKAFRLPAGFRIEIQRSYAAYLRELLTMAAAAVGASKA